MSDDFGILAVGAYIPRRRLQRHAIHSANGWFAPNMRGLAKGEKAIANSVSYTHLTLPTIYSV